MLKVTRGQFSNFFFSSDAYDDGKYHNDFGFDNIEDLEGSRFGKLYFDFRQFRLFRRFSNFRTRYWIVEIDVY